MHMSLHWTEYLRWLIESEGYIEVERGAGGLISRAVLKRREGIDLVELPIATFHDFVRASVIGADYSTHEDSRQIFRLSGGITRRRSAHDRQASKWAAACVAVP